MKRTLFLILAFAACYTTLGAAELPPRPVSDIAYRASTGDSYIDSMCRLDIHIPVSTPVSVEKTTADKGPLSTLVWFHGGGLTGGRREIPAALRDQGLIVVGVGYRFAPQVQVADCIDDAAAAAAWVARHIADYGGDAERIFVAGHSAGGYLAAMLGLDKRWMGRYELDPDTTFAAVIPYSGQAVTHFERRRELGLPATQPLIDPMAPLYHVRPDCPPMLILSGDREHELLGRGEETAYFWRMLLLAGHPDVRFCEFEGFDHGNMPQAGHFVTLRYIRELERNLER